MSKQLIRGWLRNRRPVEVSLSVNMQTRPTCKVDCKIKVRQLTIPIVIGVKHSNRCNRAHRKKIN